MQQWLDSWEEYILQTPEHKRFFLSKATSNHLRISLQSILDLCEDLWSKGFTYVLTGRLNQDPLEVSI